MSDSTDSPVARHMLRIEELVAEIEAADDGPTKNAARELTRTLLDLHRLGIEPLWSSVADPKSLSGNEAVSALMLLHGIELEKPNDVVPASRLVRSPPPADHPAEQCELCAAPIAAAHDHLWNRERRELA